MRCDQCGTVRDQTDLKVRDGRVTSMVVCKDGCPETPPPDPFPDRPTHTGTDVLVARVQLEDTFDSHGVTHVLASRPPAGDWLVVVVARDEAHTGRSRGVTFGTALTAAIADLPA
jgi:hypothetical protein